MAEPTKFVTEDGKLKKNPSWVAWKAGQADAPPPAARSVVPLGQEPQITVVSTVSDMVECDVAMTEDTRSAVEFLQGQDFLSRYYGRATGPSDVLSRLEALFAQYEVPVGMLTRLLSMAFKETLGQVSLDDSGSMDTVMTRGGSKGKTRWAVAMDRLRFLTRVFSILRLELRVRGLNNPAVVTVDQAGKSIDAVIQEWDELVTSIEMGGAGGLTASRAALVSILAEQERSGRHTSIYVIFAGRPSDAIPAELGAMMLSRPDPAKTPITMIACTDVDADVEWVGAIEEQATAQGRLSFLAAMDDYETEAAEVLRDQGAFFSGLYTMGLYFICMLFAAQDPYGLDALDDDYPLTWGMLDGLLGRVTTEAEWQCYIDGYFSNPKRVDADGKSTLADLERKYGALRAKLKTKTQASADLPEVQLLLAS